MPDIEALLVEDALRDYDIFKGLGRESAGILPSNYRFARRYQGASLEELQAAGAKLVRIGKLVEVDGRYKLTPEMLLKFGRYEQLRMF